MMRSLGFSSERFGRLDILVNNAAVWLDDLPQVICRAESDKRDFRGDSAPDFRGEFFSGWWP